MGGFGPTPKHRSRRPNRGLWATSSNRRLPAAGREGDPPPWPLGKPTAEERRIWAELWRTPQAVAWEGCGFELELARYARLELMAEKPGARIGLLGEVRQLEDRYGLNPLAMLRLRWSVEDDTGIDSETGPVVLDIRDRIHAVDTE